MLGGGNPVSSSNPSGTGGGLNIVGNHAYISTTPIASTTAETVVAKFSTGAYYVVGVLTLNAGIQLTNAADLDANALETKFNGEVVLLQHAGGQAVDATSFSAAKILIPPYTNVIMTICSEHADANNFGTVFFAGRVYA